MFMNQNKNKVIVVLLMLLLAGGSFFAGTVVGFDRRPEIEMVTTLSGKEEGMPEKIDFSAFWKAWNVLNQKYVSTKIDNKTANDEDKVYGAISGLADSLGDPYTTFFPPEEAKLFESEISGNFGGVGMEVGMKDNVVTVIAPLKNTPASRAGILSGDKVVEIDGMSTQGMSVDQAIKKIRGEKGTKVELTLLREGKKDLIKVSITRDTINIPTIDTEIKNGVFIIKLYNFSEQSPRLFRDALQKFITGGTPKLVLDLRGNPGGYLTAAIDIASWFLPSDAVVVIEDFGGKKEQIVHKSSGYNVFNDNLKMVVLVDAGSASASEILAGALKEHEIATLVGTATFGKGSVQELVPITSKTSLKVTIARWLTPKGNSISDGGLKPDVEVKVTEEDRTAGKDLQLEKALELLK